MNVGLVVGKFAPLHLGHELVIRRALAGSERVIVLSYSRPEFARCAAPQRADWLARRFPSVQSVVLAADGFVAGVEPARQHAASALARQMPANSATATAHRSFVAALCTHVLGEVDAVYTSESYGDGFAAALTAAFRRSQPARARVEHVLVDRARQRVPVSGSAIRRDPHASRAFLAPDVYAAYVDRVCLLGGESSGKTTLAAALAAHYATSCVREYGRELWVAKAGALVFGDLLRIGREQVRREEAAAGHARRYLFCDTSPLTTALYSQHLFGSVEPELAALAARPYAHTILCSPDFAFVQDGTRQDAAFRAHQHAWYRARLANAGIEPLVVSGDVAQRVRQVAAVLGAGAPDALST